MTVRIRANFGPQPGITAPDMRLWDKDGKRVRLSDYWQQSPVVLVFLRHFG